MFKVAPAILSCPPKTVIDFLKEFVKAAGPLFIVIDEIGGAFTDTNLDDIGRRNIFMDFCSDLLWKWLSLTNVFFVVLGRGSFLSYVGLRPTGMDIISSRYAFRRLNINLLRSCSIEQIIKKTLVSQRETLTLENYYQLNEDQIKEAATALYKKTNGHPRSLIDAFNSCRSLEDILNYQVPIIMESFNGLYFDGLVRYKSIIEDLIVRMEKQEVVNLTEKFVDSGGRSLTYDIIANRAFISWEGTIDNAVLYTLPFVKNMLRRMVLPFRKYLECIGDASGVSVNYANAFEWMALKRFQEIFSAQRLPCEALPRFLNTPIFGKCSVSFSSNTLLMPKITESGKRSSLSLHSPTAHPDEWKGLLNLIDELGEVCVKPRSESSSSDAFLFADASFKKRRVKLTLGLAVKNFSQATKFSLKDLMRECNLFNRMFDGTDCKDRANILVIVCTSYQQQIEALFNGKEYLVYEIKAYSSIHEVILLRLCTPDQRAAFFDTHDVLAEVIESIIHKVEIERRP